MFCSPLIIFAAFDALIEFPEGLDVIWEGTTIASISLPPICSPGGTSVPNLETIGLVQITNLDGFTTFASFILLNPSFTWTVTTTKLRVKALGTIFDNVTLTKQVSFQGRFPSALSPATCANLAPSQPSTSLRRVSRSRTCVASRQTAGSCSDPLFARSPTSLGTHLTASSSPSTRLSLLLRTSASCWETSLSSRLSKDPSVRRRFAALDQASLTSLSNSRPRQRSRPHPTSDVSWR